MTHAKLFAIKQFIQSNSNVLVTEVDKCINRLREQMKEQVAKFEVFRRNSVIMRSKIISNLQTDEEAE